VIAREGARVTDGQALELRPKRTMFVRNHSKGKFEVTVVYSLEIGRTRWPDHSLTLSCTTCLLNTSLSPVQPSIYHKSVDNIFDHCSLFSINRITTNHVFVVRDSSHSAWGTYTHSLTFRKTQLTEPSHHMLRQLQPWEVDLPSTQTSQ
jgi:hypothetical protein